MKIIFYTGKDKTDKTTMASLEALRLAEKGTHTLLISPDNNNQLSRIFNQPFINKPIKVREHLWVMQVNETSQFYKKWTTIESWLRRNMKWDELKGLSTYEVPIIPGIKGILTLLELNNYINNQFYDVIIFESQLLDEQLRLLSYPDLIEYWMIRLFERENVVFKIVKPFAKLVTSKFEFPSEEVMENARTLLKNTFELQKALLDRDKSTFCLVVNPNDLEETKKMIDTINQFQFNLQSIIVNKIYPKLDHKYLSYWYEKQQFFIDKLKESTDITLISMTLKLNDLGLQEMIGEYL